LAKRIEPNGGKRLGDAFIDSGLSSASPKGRLQGYPDPGEPCQASGLASFSSSAMITSSHSPPDSHVAEVRALRGTCDAWPALSALGPRRPWSEVLFEHRFFRVTTRSATSRVLAALAPKALSPHENDASASVIRKN